MASGIFLTVSPVWVGRIREKRAYKGENAGHNVSMGQHWKVHRTSDEFGRHNLLEECLATLLRDPWWQAVTSD